MLRLIVFYKISLMLASNLPWILAALAYQVVSLPCSLLVECNVIDHNGCPKMPITDCYENLKSALINRPFRLINRPLIHSDIFIIGLLGNKMESAPKTRMQSMQTFMIVIDSTGYSQDGNIEYRK